MKKNYGLTNTELQIMELFWTVKEPMSFKEIMNVAKSEWKKSWKAQTLNTFLLGLQKMGLVGTDKSSSNYNMYYALCTKEQHIHNWTKKMVAECYEDSFAYFVSAFIGDGKLTEEEADELRRLL